MDPTCGWNVGTARTGPHKCGRPAKALAVQLSQSRIEPGDMPNGRRIPVCGIHRRSAEGDRWYRIAELTEAGEG